MQKIAFIPTRKEFGQLEIVNYLNNAGWTTCVLCNKDSIFRAFKEAVQENNIKPNDYVIFCHDDIQILTDPEIFNELLSYELDNPETGFVGVAGTQTLNQTGVWWDGLNRVPKAPLAGFVYHGKDIHTMTSTYYGTPGRVVAMDGLFLAARGKVINTIQLGKPKFFEGEWDFYDVFYTVQTHLKSLKNKVLPISILHESYGELAGRDSWHKNREAFIERFWEKLPLSL
jgi:hypothetical protein